MRSCIQGLSWWVRSVPSVNLTRLIQLKSTLMPEGLTLDLFQSRIGSLSACSPVDYGHIKSHYIVVQTTLGNNPSWSSTSTFDSRISCKASKLFSGRFHSAEARPGHPPFARLLTPECDSYAQSSERAVTRKAPVTTHDKGMNNLIRVIAAVLAEVFAEKDYPSRTITINIRGRRLIESVLKKTMAVNLLPYLVMIGVGKVDHPLPTVNPRQGRRFQMHTYPRKALVSTPMPARPGISSRALSSILCSLLSRSRFILAPGGWNTFSF